MMAKKKPLFTGSDWDFSTIERIYSECEKLSHEMGLNTYPNQIEIISSTQMLDVYTSVGMPTMYNHWSFGKEFVREEQNYRKGHSGLAFEIVINSDPTVNYLMEENTATIQALVIAHAAFGHNHFFKNNYLFKDKTDASAIIDYLAFAKKYISGCEERYGHKEVERTIDAAHSLQNYGIDRFKKTDRSIAKELSRIREREEYIEQHYDPVMETAGSLFVKLNGDTNEKRKFPENPEENILKFVEKNSPILENWQREIIRIVRMIASYFDPQRDTKMMNEGFASYTHCHMMNRLWEKGLLTDGAMLEFAACHSSVVYQPTYHKAGAYFNPYALGLAIFKDIERICKEPTDEDKEFFPDFAGNDDYMSVIRYAVENYRDESFIRQFLSPKVIRDFRMFQLKDYSHSKYLVSHIHNGEGYKEIRRNLANQYDRSRHEPDIQVYNANLDSDRTLELVHSSINDQTLNKDSADHVLQYLKRLWGFPVVLTSHGSNNRRLGVFESDPDIGLEFHMFDQEYGIL